MDLGLRSPAAVPGGHALAAAPTADPAALWHRALLCDVDRGGAPTYVIGHRDPDADSAGSAMAYARLLDALGIDARAVVSGPINGETRYALARFGIPAPEILTDARGRQFVLVDHSSYDQAIDGMSEARILGILDHHGIGDIHVSERIDVRSAPVGATASLVFLAYHDCGVAVGRDAARLLLMGLLSDTRGMARNVSELDRAAFAALRAPAELDDPEDLYRGMAEAAASYGDMSDLAIFRSDFKTYTAGGTRFGIADVNACGGSAARQLAARMAAVMESSFPELGLDMLYTIVNIKGVAPGEPGMFMLCAGDGALDALEAAFPCFDGERLFVFENELSRKATIVPALTRVLERQAAPVQRP
ncbi:MAG: DHH family phosphoesterase [Oscillospiraceae bacterium]|nr:DHH family phosphoesterase [Oscillospiraceae bacterium]